MWWTHGSLGWGEMLFGALMMLLFWGGLIALAWFVLRAAVGSGSRRPGDEAGSSSEALRIVKERYARGEISKAEYEEIRRDIDS
jgi:putative membrane protein